MGFEEQHDLDCERTYAVRSRVWNAWGTLDDYVIAPLINPAFMGGPSWPDLRQAHMASRRPDAVLVTSDGLSDPFREPELPRVNGFGIEFYAITTDKELVEYQAITDLVGAWIYTIVGGMSNLEAGETERLAPALERFGTMSVELDASSITEGFNDTYLLPDDGVGVLLGLTDENTLPTVVDGPLSPIRLVNVKLLTRAELDFIATGHVRTDIANRRRLVELLQEQGDPLVSSLRRESVI
jgi:hypothetical protein